MPDSVAIPPIDPATSTPTPDAGAPNGAPAVVPDSENPMPDPAKPVDPPAPAASVVPDKYTLTLPATPTLDAAVSERTAAFARERGLSNEAAQAVLDFANTEAATAVGSAVKAAGKTAEDALVASWQPGDAEKGVQPGTKWTEQHNGWLAESLAHPELGAGDQTKLDAKVALAASAFDKFASPELKAALNRTGYGSYAPLLLTFAKIGEAMAEGQPILAGGTTGPAGGRKSDADVFYPKKD